MDHGPGARAGRAGLRPLPLQPPALHVGGKTLHEGLLAGDGQWYERIARHGYRPILPPAPRLFPPFSLLAAPAVVEGLRGVRGLSASEAAGRLAAVAAPFAGVGTYLIWVGARFGHPMLPLDIQQRSWLRDGFLNPAVALWRSARAAFSGHFGCNGLHFPLLVVAIV